MRIVSSLRKWWSNVSAEVLRVSVRGRGVRCGRGGSLLSALDAAVPWDGGVASEIAKVVMVVAAVVEVGHSYWKL